VFIGTCLIRLHLPENHSLKGKRHVLKSIISRLHNEFNVSAAEVGEMDVWQVAELGVCCVSNDSQHSSEVISKVIDFVERARLEAVVIEVSTEVLQAF